MLEMTSPWWFKIETADYEKLKEFVDGKRTDRKNITLDEIDLKTFETTFMQMKKRKHSEELPDL